MHEPPHGISKEALRHGMVERLRRMSRREIAHTALANFVPPAGRGLFVIRRDRAEQEVLLIEIVLRHVLLVEYLEILHARRDRVIFVFDADRERIRLGMAAKITAEEFIIRPPGGYMVCALWTPRKPPPLLTKSQIAFC